MGNFTFEPVSYTPPPLIRTGLEGPPPRSCNGPAAQHGGGVGWVGKGWHEDYPKKRPQSNTRAISGHQRALVTNRLAGSLRHPSA